MTIFEDLPINFTNHFIKALESHESSFFIEGSLSEESLSALISGIHSKNIGLQHLIVVENSKVAKKIAKCFQFFNPSLNVQLLFGFDISAYSNLYPNKKLIAQRLGWMHQAQNGSTQTIFIATIEGLTQKTIPFSILHKHTSLFKIGSDFFEHPHKELIKLGYIPSPVVEDIGTFSIRGGLIDIFSPAHKHPIRIELFADEIHSLREFDESTQRTLNNLNTCAIIPAQETVLESDYYLHALDKYQADLKHRSEFVKEFPTDYLRQLSQGHYFQGQEFLVSYFYKEAVSALDHFSSNLNIWHFNPMAITQHLDLFLENLKIEHDNSLDLPICPKPEDQYVVLKELTPPPDTKDIYFSKVHVLDHVEEKSTYSFPCSPLIEIRQKFHNLLKDPNDHSDYLKEKLIDFKNKNFSVFIISSSERQTQKIKLLLDDQNFQVEVSDSTNFQWENWINEQNQNLLKINLIHGQIPEGFNLNAERIIFITDDDILGKRRTYKTSATETLSEKAHALSFGELKIDDLIVHKLHGVGIYKGLKTMPIAGIESEFIQIEYKDSDKLYLPIYQIGQIQKYSGPKASQLLNKLGGNGWEKTKVKVKSKIHDLAAELLKLYAARSQLTRAPYSEPDRDFQLFEKEFPYEETPGQQKAIDDVLKNLCSDKPMDRLICGDVGFGKTEVAMRACFKIIQDKKQVAVIAPTTILTFQHFQNFKKRFKNWPIKIAVLNRFVKPKEIRQNIQEIKDGQIDLVIGTHRLFSKDIQFKDLGLLVIDEEQRFGVKHKEQIRQLKTMVDTLTLSATPIPRTLNLSLMGMRDLTLINTAPMDRLPTRTFVTRFDKGTIKKAVESELSRGGQVFFLHNKVQSIYALADELRSFLPNVTIAVGHGQMQEKELEETMLKFFNQKIDLLVCTTIIESGIDIPTANTMFIDNAHSLGLSQLYQLRGRVGRSKRRAYCYLMVPKNRKLNSVQQERLRVIQENTELGSGIKIAHYDLELRGSGNILGQDQSGQINAVGYELYLELLENELNTLKGEPQKEQLDPEINLKIPALIPDIYISDIRIRLAYYKALSQIQTEAEVDVIEEELTDQFGKPPEQVYNLIGIMLIRKYCKDLSIRDLTAGPKNLSLTFTENTPLSVVKVLGLTNRPNKKYTLTPSSQLKIRMNEITWPRVYDELAYLKTI